MSSPSSSKSTSPAEADGEPSPLVMRGPSTPPLVSTPVGGRPSSDASLGSSPTGAKRPASPSLSHSSPSHPPVIKRFRAAELESDHSPSPPALARISIRPISLPTAAAVPVAIPNDATSVSRVPSAATSAAPSVPLSDSNCHVCRRRLGLIQTQCRCGGYYCMRHLSTETHLSAEACARRTPADSGHVCNYDYRAEGRSVLAHGLPKVSSDRGLQRL